jgi:IclR family KDG regulon transcriptional repressor
MDGKPNSAVQSIDRALDVLELLSAEQRSLSITEIAEKTRLHKTTAHRILCSLRSRGYIEKKEGKNGYELGMKIIHLASAKINDLELLTESRAILTRFQLEVNLGVQLGVLDGADVVYVDEIDGTIHRKYTRMGFRSPAYCSSLGKCLLAGLSGEKLEELFHRMKLIRYTATTICDWETLRAELRVVREQGWALNNGEHDINLRSVAAPIYDYNGDVIAAINAGGHSTSLTEERIAELVPMVKKTALLISNKLGNIS